MSVTEQRAREFLQYDPESGQFVWKVSKGTARAGDVAGASLRKNGYYAISIDGRRYYAHRLAWLFVHGKMPAQCIDHIDGDRTNNRIANLRDVPARINFHNQPSLRRNNTSGFKGVSWSTQRKRFVAQISINRRPKFLGFFDNPEDASAAYWEAKKQFAAYPPCA